jgi:hypothetical protein
VSLDGVTGLKGDFYISVSENFVYDSRLWVKIGKCGPFCLLLGRGRSWLGIVIGVLDRWISIVFKIVCMML